MSRNKTGVKAGRAEANAAFQRDLKQRKRVRRARAEYYAGSIAEQQERARKATGDDRRAELEKLTMGPLRDLAKEAGVHVRHGWRKADLIGAILRAAS